MALKGLSTAFTRMFMSNPSVNGSLSTVQEISSGIVKQGSVDIFLEQAGKQESIFTVRYLILYYYYLEIYFNLFPNFKIKVKELSPPRLKLLFENSTQRSNFLFGVFFYGNKTCPVFMTFIWIK